MLYVILARVLTRDVHRSAGSALMRKFRSALALSALFLAAATALASRTPDFRHKACLTARPENARVLAATLPPDLERRSLYSLIAADVDRDGYLDIVAVDWSLQLTIWTNDGSGRLVRQEPARAPNEWESLPAPRFSDLAPGSPELLQTSAAAIAPNRPRHFGGLVSRPLRALFRPDIASTLLNGSQGPRAPPVVS